MINHIQELLRNGDSFAAIEHIQRQGASLEVATQYDALVRDLYWKAHDLPAVVTIGRAGILYCLGQAIVADGLSDDAKKLRSFAKGMAYNVSSFIWPGWEEPGIDPTPDDLQLGRDCAALNLRLAIELNRPPKAMSMAYWLVGAHALTSGDFDRAEKEFERAHQVLTEPDEIKSLEPCNLGYLAVARLCKTPSDPDAQAQFDKITADLAARTDEDAKVYLPQLLSARRLYVRS